jgi:hypothetical protein
MMENPYSIEPNAMGSFRWRRHAKGRYPDEPWMWQKEWATGRIRSSSKRMMLFSGAFALFWNAVSVPAIASQLPEALSRGDQDALWMVLFPIVGLGLLVWAVLSTMQWRRFGTAEFEMATVPGVIGGELRGTLHLGTRLHPPNGFDLKLVCVHRVRSGGKNNSTSEFIQWQEERKVRAEESGYGPHGTTIPVAFTVPYDCDPSSPTPSSDQILWRLEARADIPGVNLKTRFEVPVFKTPESDPEVSELPKGEAIATELLDPAGTPVAEGSRIRVAVPAPGQREFIFPAARNPGVAAGITAFATFWTGSVAAMVCFEVPTLFTVAFGLFDLLLLAGVTSLWFGSARVRVGRGRVEIRSRVLGLGRTREIPGGEIEEIKPLIGLQTNATPFYDIKIVCRNGRSRTAARWIRSKREAGRLAAAMMQALHGLE